MKLTKKWLSLFLCGVTAFSLFACSPQSTSSDSLSSGVTTSPFRQEADYSPRNGVKREWNKVSSYFCNYGAFQEEMLDYDVAIIGRNVMSAEDMQKFSDAGVWTIAYISLGEDYSLNVGDGLGPGGYASYYLYDESDMPIANGDWGSYYVDPGHPAWRTIVLNEVRRLVETGVDGIFMDTVDSVDRFPETFNSMCGLIKEIREAFPDIKMVLNRGFTVVPTLYPVLDGVMFELFSTYYNLKVFKYDVLDTKSVQFNYNRFYGVSIVNACRQVKYFPVFALEYYPRDGFDSDKQWIYDTDWEYDFIPYLTMEGREIGGAITDYRLRPESERGIKALSVRDNEDLLEKNGDTSAANLAYEGNGAKITVDSVFTGYGKSALTDGYISNAENFDLLGWQFANWASAETESAHYVEVKLPKAHDLTKMTVYWAYDNGNVYSSRAVSVQAYIGEEWVTVGEAKEIENGVVSTEIALSDCSGVTKIRLFQEAGYGSVARRNLMWIGEIALY